MADTSLDRETRVAAQVVVRALAVRLSDKWTIPVVCILARRPRHFGELRRELGGSSSKVLSAVLRSLQRDGLVSRHPEPVRRQVEYRLTETGRLVARLIRRLARPAERLVGEMTVARHLGETVEFEPEAWVDPPAGRDPSSGSLC
jgi:DNA-binding HxlR family transcriptional regulator